MLTCSWILAPLQASQFYAFQVERVIHQLKDFLGIKKEICGLAVKGAQMFFAVSHACSSFLVKSMGFGSKSQHRFFSCPLVEQWAALHHVEETSWETASIVWEQTVVPKLSDSEDLSLSSVKVGARRCAGLRYMDAIDCFDSFVTACLRLLNETVFLSLGVTRCYFFPSSMSQAELSWMCKEAKENECCVSRCSSELVSAWGMNVPRSKAAGGGRCSWARCQQLSSLFCRPGRVLQDRLCYWRLEALSFSSLNYLTRLAAWGAVAAAAKSCFGDCHLRVKLSASVLLWGSGI